MTIHPHRHPHDRVDGADLANVGGYEPPAHDRANERDCPWLSVPDDGVDGVGHHVCEDVDGTLNHVGEYVGAFR